MDKHIYYVVSLIFIVIIVIVVIYHEHGSTTSNIIIAGNTTSCVTGTPCAYQDVVDFRVIVIAFNRANSLSKILRSLNTLVLDENRAALEIWIDRFRNNGVDQRTVEVASEFSWKGGPVRVHVQVVLNLNLEKYLFA